MRESSVYIKYCVTDEIISLVTFGTIVQDYTHVRPSTLLLATVLSYICPKVVIIYNAHSLLSQPNTPAAEILYVIDVHVCAQL